MVLLKRTNSDNKDFRQLVTALDIDLKIRDGEEHSFYAQFNKIDKIKYAVVAYQQNEPVGCGAIKEYSKDIMEIKRMYVPPNKRGRGIASIILKELERWCTELNYKKCILETGKRQVEAKHLYKKQGYRLIPNYGQYSGMDNSLCFEKDI